MQGMNIIGALDLSTPGTYNMMLTADEAAAILLATEHHLVLENRAPSPIQVEKYQTDMQNEWWIWNGERILFFLFPDGGAFLADGRQRLWAVRGCTVGVPLGFEVIAVSGVADARMRLRTIDNGRRRTLIERLRFAGVVNDLPLEVQRSIATAVNAVLVADVLLAPDGGWVAWGKLTEEDRMRHYTTQRLIVNWLAEYRVEYGKVNRGRKVPMGVLAALADMKRHAPDETMAFIDDLQRGELNIIRSPVRVLRDQIADARNTTPNAYRYHLWWYNLTAHMWNRHRNGEMVSQLRLPEGKVRMRFS